MRLSLISASLLLISGCASNVSNTPRDTSGVEVRDVVINPSRTRQTNEESSGVYNEPVLEASPLGEQEAARQTSRAEYYRQQAAGESNVSAKVEATLSSAEYYIQAQQPQRAVELVNSVRNSLRSEQQKDRAAVILAYADYSVGNYDAALTRLDYLLRSAQTGSVNNDVDQPQLPEKQALSTQQVDAYLLASFCYQAQGDYEQGIASLINREAGLYGSARAETTRYIWQVINSIPTDQRQRLLQEAQDPMVRNRIEQSLAGAIGSTQDTPQQFNQWREEPSSSQALNVVESGWSANSPESIYVLLPFSSRFAKAAQAVKAGIEREHELNTSTYRPRINYYDIGDNPLQVSQYYAAAVRAGADFIIGPLGKSYSNEANNASNYARSAVPMLMLGGDQALAASNLRLSMSPELEGRLVAERAWQDGHISAAQILTRSAQDQRVSRGFEERWLSLGGKLSKKTEYSPAQYDHSVELKQLFDINQSEYRHRKLTQTLGFKPKFSTYQRGDIDFVLMVANNKTGRILRPQINFFTNSQLPVYSTSGVYNGIEDAVNNMDLDDTILPVMPWVFRSGSVTQYAGQLNMLHAMGMDAYQVAGNLSTLTGRTDAALNGHTGQLYLQGNGEVIHRPVWAKFEAGQLKVLDSKGLDISPLTEDGAYLPNDATGTNSTSTGSYNDQNWDTRESRRKAGG